MNMAVPSILAAVAIGLGASLVMDLWNLFLKRAFGIPSAQARMIRARSARRRSGSPARRTSSARSSSDSTITAAEGPGCDMTTG